MVDVNDPSNLSGKLAREWERVENAAIADQDEAAIIEFIEFRRDIQDKARNTLITDMSHLRRASLRADVDLVAMERPDVEDLLTLLQQPKDEGGYGLDADSSSIYSYKRVLRLFFEYLNDHPAYDDREWWDDIEIPSLEMRGASTRDEMLTGEEVEQLKDAARTHETSTRDRALISLLADVGGRITLVCAMRVGDVYPDGDEPYFEPNDELEDGDKNIDVDEIPILHSRGELRTFIRHHHPDPETPEAPLWPLGRGYNPDNPQDCAMSPSRARDVLRKCAEEAGIDTDRVDPHNFRRTAATRLSSSERLEPQEIRQIMGWSEKSYQEMLATYDHTADSERNSAIHQELGFSDGSDADESADLSLETVVCGTCRTTYSSARFCPSCGAARDEEARALSREIDDEAGDEAIQADDADEATTFENLRRFARDNPEEAVEAMEEALHQASTSSSTN